MIDNDFLGEEDEEGFFRKNRLWIGLAITGLLVGGGVWASQLLPDKKAPPRLPPELTMVSIKLPPPPPPPPQPKPKEEPKEEEKKEEKMIEQPKMEEPEEKPDEPPPKADEPPQAPIGTGIVGNGPGDGFGLGYGSGMGGNGTGGLIGGNGTGGRRGSRWGWYAGQVQSAIADALRRDRRTRAASLSVHARIWADSTGRITRAQISGSTGNPSLDSAIRNEILTGLQLQEAPPQDMPMPINLRLTARKPN